ncbi:sigma-70 family RNA polymerase sigma factor [Pediococcus claussenii]|uniref:RNA polymerase sigma factor SigS n=1 Tax=Pediococcus claussenii (strain ATCC BAA-344 / DSM 14800 / JCM 18046 / KCTC 3811 / LMG 21948 / P06) TaxID=701521 RepID=G8PBM2_PEDCP|nr:sigma-70 family RNA polymerase sigma factor [Pediococcus claussenii]AEV94771.1 RNA polymerase sigma factor, sigma-70 family protein [Pediococcus claussenii ATCC BAA-344]ANZ69967.1 hypothetical protein AYR57_06415 [Pediococcus claussenii]ANZ71783.1 hypothetical protein AYR58_06415 [Pediococcus claussenii]KRN20951.1 hypothetical protein IV79_GL000176 [Pediococcus claussenii]
MKKRKLSRNEQELLRLAKQGDQEAFNELFNKYLPVVKGLMTKYTIRGFDFDDWLQEGRLVFFKTICNFDIDRGFSLGVFFKNNFTNRICSLLRFEMAYKRKAGFEAQCLELVTNDQGELTINPRVDHSDPHGELLVKEAYSEYETLLSEFEYAVSHQMFKGYSVKTIACNMKCTEKRVQNAIMRCKRKLIQRIYDDGTQ